MKLLSLLLLSVFLNFMALPILAPVFHWDTTTSKLVLSEEETHPSPFIINEKTLPKKLDVHDFLIFFESDLDGQNFCETDDAIHLSPLLTIFSPPPNV